MIITIGRECGCRGDSVGKALAKKFNIPFYDKNAIKELAKKSGAYDKYPNFLLKSRLIRLFILLLLKRMLLRMIRRKKLLTCCLTRKILLLLEERPMLHLVIKGCYKAFYQR